MKRADLPEKNKRHPPEQIIKKRAEGDKLLNGGADVATVAKQFENTESNYLLDAADDILAFSAFPFEHWKKIRSNNPHSVNRRSVDLLPVRRSSASSARC